MAPGLPLSESSSSTTNHATATTTTTTTTTTAASTCVICLESLANNCTDNGNNNGGGAIGVITPCGHCLHVECWNGWYASCLQRSRDAKCPTCNGPATDFVRLYVNFGGTETENTDMDEDECSLSSVESGMAKEQEGNKAGAVESHTANIEEPSYPPLEDDTDDRRPEVIVLDNESDAAAQSSRPSTWRSKAPSRSPTTKDKSDDGKYKKIARRLKKRVQLLETTMKDHTVEREGLLSKVADITKDFETMMDDLAEAGAQRDTQQRKIEGFSLQVVSLERKYRTKAQKLEQAEDQLAALQRKFNDVEKHYERKLKLVSANTLNEVQQLLDEHPKTVNENCLLKEEIKKLRRQLPDTTNDRATATSDRRSRRTTTTASDQHKRTRQLLREFSQHNEYENDSGGGRSHGKNNNSKASRFEGIKKRSAHAARLSTASTARMHRTHGSTSNRGGNPLDVLYEADHAAAGQSRRSFAFALEPVLPSFLQPHRGSSAVAASVKPKARVRHTSASHQKTMMGYR